MPKDKLLFSGDIMRNIAFKLEYDGTSYHGWQRQDNAVTVQEVLENTIAKVTGEHTSVIGCSRTDTGVHALGYICNFHTNSRIPTDKFPYALNTQLPSDIRVLQAFEVAADFHARYCSKGKKYRYKIINTTFHSVFQRNYACHWPYPLNVELMKKAAQYFVGEHDFKAFMATGSSVKDTVRNVYALSVEKYAHEIIMEISANGFLYNMVRIIAGTLLYVGNHRIDVEDIPYILNKGDRTQAGITAPAQGLYLVEVYY